MAYRLRPEFQSGISFQVTKEDGSTHSVLVEPGEEVDGDWCSNWSALLVEVPGHEPPDAAPAPADPGDDGSDDDGGETVDFGDLPADLFSLTVRELKAKLDLAGFDYSELSRKTEYVSALKGLIEG